MAITDGILLLMLIWIREIVQGTPMCISGDFDNQVQSLLVNVMLDSTELQKIDLMIPNLQEKLRTRWDGADLSPFGSYINGLGLKASDVDLYLQIPDYNVTADGYIAHEIAKLLYQEPDKYSNIQLRWKEVVPLMTFYDISIGRYVDLSFNTRAMVEKTRLVAYYLSLDKRNIQLAVIVKLWNDVHKLTGGGIIHRFSIYLLVVFYLQQKRMAPSVYEVQASIPPEFLRKWDSDFEKAQFTVANNETLYELLGGFFKYYAGFNFEQYCVSPHVGRPIAKSDFDNVNTIPKEFLLYKEYIIMDSDAIEPMVDDVICIQDVLSHTNTIQTANAEVLLHLINHFKAAARNFDEVPKERFLTSLFIGDGDKDIITQDGEHADSHETLILKDCYNEV